MHDVRSNKEKMLAGELYLADDPELVGSVGTDVSIRRPFYVDYGSHLTIGDRVFANYGLTALDCAPVSIGDNVWLGGGVIVLAGVSIGENAVIGAGSVVVHDIPANVLAVGSPAKTVREL